MSGSPSFSLSSLDWKSIAWTFATAALGAVLTVAIDSVLPELKEKGLIDAGIFTLVTTFLHAVRKWLTDTRVPNVVLLIVAGLSLLCASASAQELVDLGGPDGEYHYKVVRQGGKIIKVTGPLSVHRPVPPDGNPPTNPPPIEPQPPTTAFVLEIQKQTQAALDSGASKTAAAGLSAVFGLVSSGVADESIPAGKVFPFLEPDGKQNDGALKRATDSVMKQLGESESAKWSKWRADISAALNQLRSQGHLDTKDEIAGVLKDVASGIDKATGFTVTPKSLALLDPVGMAAVDRADGKADGILDGVDLAKLVELIKIILELLKIFKGI